MREQVMRLFLCSLLLVCGLLANTQEPEVSVTDTVELASGTDEESYTDDSVVVEARSVYLSDTLLAADSLPVAARTVPSAALEEIREGEEFWYLRERFAKEQEEEESGWLTALFRRGWMRLLFWALIGCGVLALLYLFLESMNIRLFGRREESARGLEEGELSEEDFFSTNYPRAIADALVREDYRLAIRFRYLQLLRELSERNIIQYRHERPNGVYVAQLLGTPHHEVFARVTRLFEYSWYGQMPVARPADERMERDIHQLKTGLS